MNRAAYRAIGQDVLAELAVLCREHDVPHGRLLEGAMHFNNHGITDGSKVFIKLGRHGQDQEGGFGVEIAASTFAREHGIEAPRALAPLLFLEDGRAVTIWGHEATTAQATTNLPTAQASGVVRASLRSLSLEGLELPSMTGRFRSVARAFHTRLDGVAHPEVSRLQEISFEIIEKVTALPPSPHCYMQHGDMHPRNVAWQPGGGLMVFDWESSLLAPPEWEYAEFIRDGTVWGASATEYLTRGLTTAQDFDQALANDLAWLRMASSFSLMIRVVSHGGGWASNDIGYRAEYLGVKDLPGLLAAAAKD